MKRLLIIGLAVSLGIMVMFPAFAETQHQRIERKLDEALSILRGPVVPPDIKPHPPSANPFVAWCKEGNTIPQFIMLRNGGIGLSPAQEAQALAAGCFAPPAPSGPAAPAQSLAELSDTAPHVFVTFEGQPQTFTLTLAKESFVECWLVTVSGSTAAEVRDTGFGFVDRVSRPAGSDFRHGAFIGRLPAGRYTYTATLFGVLGTRFMIQCNVT